MTVLANYTDCGTAGLKALDLQLVKQMQIMAPGSLVDFRGDPNLKCGAAVHPFLTKSAKEALCKCLASTSKQMYINSAYRTIAQQYVLYNHYRSGRRCGIRAAARPGASNHNTGLAIDIEDAQGWRPILLKYGWKWIGAFDPMHFDYIGGKNISSVSIRAFQRLWNYNYPDKKIAEDGVWGYSTEQALRSTNINGFSRLPFEMDIMEDDVITTGERGELVKQIQRVVGLNPDGIYGAATIAKVKDYQRSKGLLADGVVGKRTLAIMGILA